MNMWAKREVQHNHEIYIVMSNHKPAVCRNITTNCTKCLILTKTNIYL